MRVRVVAHSCSNTEIVCALGCAELLVGVDDHSDHPPEVVAGLPRIGPDLEIDVERVAALKPDLVLASLTVPGHERNVARLQQAGLPTLVLEPTGLPSILDDIVRVGEALGVASRASELVASMRAEIEALSEDEVSSRPPVLVEWWPKPVIVPGQQSWVTDLIHAAGGVNPFGGRPVKSTPVTDEEVCEAAPEACVIAWCGVPLRKYRPEVVLRRPAWAGVPAVRAGRVVPISEAWLGRPGPRVVEGLRALREVVLSCRG